MKARIFLIAAALVSGLYVTAGVQSPAWAVVTAPCSSPAVTTNMSPINGGTSTYCVTGFGWTDTWFPTTQPTAYDQHLDVLSGDDAPSLSYTLNTPGSPPQKVGTGNIFNFLSPFLDGGHLTSQNIGGEATLLTDLPVGKLTNSGSSTISVAEVQIGITTTVHPDNSVTQAFHFTNTSPIATVTGLTFDDYFNFHPDGSAAGTNDQNCGITSFNPGTGTVTTTGASGGGCSPVVATGSMTGSLLPATWDLGNVGSVTCTTPGDPTTCTTTPGVLADIVAGTFNMALGPVGPGDTGADLVWDLPNLAPGASETFTITKNFNSIPPGPPLLTPEPGSLALLGSALLGLGAARRLRRKS